MTNMAREQLVARLNLVKRLMSRANLFVLGGGNGHETFVTQYTNNQLQEQKRSRECQCVKTKTPGDGRALGVIDERP